ncbi:hypothetical protein [Halalkalicoccus subterraneus]|uniref:hypothetical protein n=1 Tax=Halalkalicoccus subterraneus TaxID=2675002 RepID=UPI001FE9C894|nr:hypothetical protein [Halalkalicoccus subterraneus]
MYVDIVTSAEPTRACVPIAVPDELPVSEPVGHVLEGREDASVGELEPLDFDGETPSPVR